MLAEVTKEIAARLAPLGVAVEYDGADRLDQELVVRNWIRVGEGQDAFVSMGPKLDKSAQAWAAVEWMNVTIEAASTKAGATVEDHRRLVKDFRDAFLVAAQRVLHGRGCPLMQGTTGAFVESGAAIEVGARYELKLGYQRSIYGTAAEAVTDSTITAATTITAHSGGADQASCGD